MSFSHTNVDGALLHASLLAYFWDSAATCEARDTGNLPSENTSGTNAHQLLHSCLDDDEESRYGFWGEPDVVERLSGPDSSCKIRSATRGAATFCCLWCAFSVIIFGAFGLYFAVDLAFSHYGLGTGMAEWVMYGHPFPWSKRH
jgi:hypothetical protein